MVRSCSVAAVTAATASIDRRRLRTGCNGFHSAETTARGAPPLAALGNYLANTGRTSESVTWYEQALTLDPDNSTIRLDFARSLAEGEKRADAELQFQKVIAAEPNNAQAHYSLAGLYANWL